MITWPTLHGDTVEVYESEIGDGTIAHPLEEGWRYRVRSANRKIVETGSEGYTRKHAAIKAARRHHPEVTP